MSKTVLITGAAGFIGRSCIAAWRDKYRLVCVDNLINPQSTFPTDTGVEFYQSDVRDIKSLPLPKIDAVVHLAAQTAVTLSESSPMADYIHNIEATMRLIEWAGDKPLIYASTNKVYGELEGIRTPIKRCRKIDPQTPYGVSKCSADLLVQELCPRGLSLRQSCVYGPLQKGSVDQGWVAHMLNCHRAGKGFTIYGDGKQVRDLLHVDDLIRFYELCIERLCGGWKPTPKYFVVGGGRDNAVSLIRALELIEFSGEITYEPKRSRDQDYFVSSNDGMDEYSSTAIGIPIWEQQHDARQWLKESGAAIQSR